MLISVQASLPVKHAKYVGEGRAQELGLSLLSFFLLFVVSKYVGGTGVGCGIENVPWQEYTSSVVYILYHP